MNIKKDTLKTIINKINSHNKMLSIFLIMVFSLFGSSTLYAYDFYANPVYDASGILDDDPYKDVISEAEELLKPRAITVNITAPSRDRDHVFESSDYKKNNKIIIPFDGSASRLDGTTYDVPTFDQFGNVTGTFKMKGSEPIPSYALKWSYQRAGGQWENAGTGQYMELSISTPVPPKSGLEYKIRLATTYGGSSAEKIITIKILATPPPIVTVKKIKKLKVTLTHIKSVYARDDDNIADFRISQWIDFTTDYQGVRKNLKYVERDIITGIGFESFLNTLINADYAHQVHVRQGEKKAINNSMVFEVDINNDYYKYEAMDFDLYTDLMEISSCTWFHLIGNCTSRYIADNHKYEINIKAIMD